METNQSNIFLMQKHQEAERLAFEELEKELLSKKDYPRLKALQEEKEERGVEWQLKILIIFRKEF